MVLCSVIGTENHKPTMCQSRYLTDTNGVHWAMLVSVMVSFIHSPDKNHTSPRGFNGANPRCGCHINFWRGISTQNCDFEIHSWKNSAASKLTSDIPIQMNGKRNRTQIPFPIHAKLPSCEPSLKNGRIFLVCVSRHSKVHKGGFTHGVIRSHLCSANLFCSVVQRWSQHIAPCPTY